MRLLPILIIGTVVLFLAALIAPRKSKRLERWVQRRLQEGKQKGRGNAGRLGDWTAKSLDWGRRWIDAVMTRGRRLRAKLPL